MENQISISLHAKSRHNNNDHRITQNLLPCSQFEAGTVTLVIVVTWCAGTQGGFSGAIMSGLDGGSLNNQRVFSSVVCAALLPSLENTAKDAFSVKH